MKAMLDDEEKKSQKSSIVTFPLRQTIDSPRNSPRSSFDDKNQLLFPNSADDGATDDSATDDDDDSEGIQNSGNLKPTLSNISAVAIIVGTIVGSGIFASPGVVLYHSGSSGAALIVWTLCGLLAYLGACCYAELGAALPDSGGEVHYLHYIYGSMFSFLFSWTNAVVTRPASLAIIATVFGEYTCLLFWPENVPRSELSPIVIRITAIICIALVTAINSISVNSGMFLQCATTCLKVLALALIILSGLYYAIFIKPGMDEKNYYNYYSVNHSNNKLGFGKGDLGFTNTTTSIGDFGLAFQAGLWSYDGWNNLNYAVTEMKSPQSLPYVIRTATLLVVVLYILANIAYLHVLPLNVVRTSEAVGTDYGRLMLGGTFGGLLVTLSVVTSTLGALNGSIFSGSRLVHSAAKKELLPSCLACVDRRRDSPIRALLCQGTIGSVLCMFGTFDTLVNYFGAAAWMFYLATVFGVLVLRWREPNLHRPFKVWISNPIIFCLFALMLVFTPLMVSPRETIAAFMFILIGIPVWFWRVKLERRSVYCCDMKNGKDGFVPAHPGLNPTKKHFKMQKYSQISKETQNNLN